MLPAQGRVLGHSLLAFHHQEELPPPRGDRGHLPLPKLQFVVLPLECGEPEGTGWGGAGIMGAQHTCLGAPLVSVALHPRDGHISGCHKGLVGALVPSHPLPSIRNCKKEHGGLVEAHDKVPGPLRSPAQTGVW